MAENNAKIYGVYTIINYINNDFLKLDKTKDFKSNIDIVFISPPWGGLSYANEQIYDLQAIKPNFCDIFKKALSLADNIALFLPRNVNIKQLIDMLHSFDSLFLGQGKESFVRIEAIIYIGHLGCKIAAVLVLIGPLFQVFFIVIFLA